MIISSIFCYSPALVINANSTYIWENDTKKLMKRENNNKQKNIQTFQQTNLKTKDDYIMAI